MTALFHHEPIYLFKRYYVYYSSATYLCFCGHFFKQAHGTAMGYPVSVVVVANVTMEDVEECVLANYDVQLPFWKHNVDDVCTAVPTDKVQH